MLKFICYPKCSTCIKARKYLQLNNIEFEERNISIDNPTKEELSEWLSESNLDIKKFFNTSGNLYKSMNLKDKLKDMTTDEKLELLSTNGMLVKRPIVIYQNTVLVGFKEVEYENLLKEVK